MCFVCLEKRQLNISNVSIIQDLNQVKQTRTLLQII